MTGRHVCYTDPPWLVSDGRLDPALATIEAAVLGPDVALSFGPFAGGRYGLAGPALLTTVAGAEVLVVYRCEVTTELLDAAGGGLRAVIRQGVGTDNLHAELLAGRGLIGLNVPDYCVDEVSTHTTALALALERAVIPQHQSLTGGRFDIYAGGTPRRTSDCVLGIVGFGRIGRAVARKLGAHYGRVLVFDPYLGRDLAQGYGAAAAETLPELLAASDVVTLHCPLTAETEQLIDRAALRAMRPGAFLINAARGKLIDPAALDEALAAGWIAGAGLDVFSPEDPNTSETWRSVLRRPGVVVTSHRAFLSQQAEQSSRRRVAELARDLLDGRTPRVGLVTAR